MYPFMTLNDDTEITHSEIKPDGSVKVYIETPDINDGFHDATCWLPEHRWESIHGYSKTEMAYFKQLIQNNAHLIIEFSQKGGKENLYVIDAQPLEDMMMILTFSNGEKRLFDATILQGPVFLPLSNPAIFKNCSIVDGVVTWMNEEIDCAPEYMYEKSYVYEDMSVLM
jgi:hypothetical protein